MRRQSLLFSAFLALVLAACGSTPGATDQSGPSLAPEATAGVGGGATAGPAATEGPVPTEAGGGTGSIPADCAAGFIEYLKAIGPVVAGFDPAEGTMAELSELDQAVSLAGFELMDANGGSATYSCSDVGLEFNYFDASSPWAAIHEIVSTAAPGAGGYLQATEQIAMLDDDVLADHGMASCEDAAAKIKADVADAMAAGAATMDGMTVEDAAPLLGLYNAYNTEVREGRCTNSLGNDEFGFMSVY
jgi:hypothetical protein